jgi:hypothetical protein
MILSIFYDKYSFNKMPNIKNCYLYSQNDHAPLQRPAHGIKIACCVNLLCLTACPADEKNCFTYLPRLVLAIFTAPQKKTDQTS